MIYPTTNSQYEDEFNLSNKRNVRNTPRRTYNCGGFALGCFSWYCPREDFFQYAFNDYAEALVKTPVFYEVYARGFRRPARYFFS